MATINYNGMELKVVTEPQIFDPPKKMLVWNNIMDYAITSLVVAIVERMDGICAICHDGEIYPYCAEIPETQKPRRATNRELARWLAQGNGEWINVKCDTSTSSDYLYEYEKYDEPLIEDIRVRKWLDTEWHEPTVDYLGINDKDCNFNKKYGEV